jgi:hypothetical protein
VGLITKILQSCFHRERTRGDLLEETVNPFIIRLERSETGSSTFGASLLLTQSKSLPRM